MNEETPEKQVRDFYRRWSRPVFAFCCLFLGDERGGEEATREAFLAYFRRGLPPASNQLPIDLLRCAMDAVKDKCALADPQNATNGTLEHAILVLPCEQRAIFILRNVLRVDAVSVGAITGLGSAQVSQLWIQSLLSARKLLPRDFFKERSQ